MPEPEPELAAAATGLADSAALPAVTRNVVFGTAGWTDKTLISSGLFYPRGTSSPEARLKHYASHFAMVEVDSTYYTLLPLDVAARWVEWTPESFCFDVKAHPIVTGHPVETERLPADLRERFDKEGLGGRVYPDRMPAELAFEIERRFRDLCEVIRSAGKLGCVMVQFPPWFGATRGNARRIESLAERWSGVPLSIELRNRGWFEHGRVGRLFDLLRAHQLSYVCVDEPDVERGGVPPVIEVTNPELSLVRFHGHNRPGWSKKDATVHERFGYLYAPHELGAWVEPVQKLSRESKRVHAIFNNCVRNFAVLGAKGLSVLLSQAPAPAPP